MNETIKEKRLDLKIFLHKIAHCVNGTVIEIPIFLRGNIWICIKLKEETTNLGSL